MRSYSNQPILSLAINTNTRKIIEQCTFKDHPLFPQKPKLRFAWKGRLKQDLQTLPSPARIPFLRTLQPVQVAKPRDIMGALQAGNTKQPSMIFLMGSDAAQLIYLGRTRTCRHDRLSGCHWLCAHSESSAMDDNQLLGAANDTDQMHLALGSSRATILTLKTWELATGKTRWA